MVFEEVELKDKNMVVLMENRLSAGAKAGQ
jgi:hypothetical protein